MKHIATKYYRVDKEFKRILVDMSWWATNMQFSNSGIRIQGVRRR